MCLCSYECTLFPFFQGDRLSDERLIIGILIFVMLMAILLIVWCTDNIHQVTTIVPDAMVRTVELLH